MNDVGFMISKVEDLAMGPGTRIDCSRCFVWQSCIKVRKGTEKASDRHQKGDGECPPRRSKQGSYILFNWLFGSVQSLSRV